MAQNRPKMAQSRVKMAQSGPKWPKMAQNGPKMGVTEHFGAILSHFEDFVSVWERPWAAKVCGAVKMGVRERPKPSARSKKGSKWLNGR